MKPNLKHFNDTPKKLVENSKILFTGLMQDCKEQAKKLMQESEEPRVFEIWNEQGTLLCRCEAKPRRTLLWTAKGRLVAPSPSDRK